MRSPICLKIDFFTPSPLKTLSCPRYDIFVAARLGDQMFSMPDWLKMNAAVFSGT